jgi:type I restriction enzyme S subunit
LLRKEIITWEQRKLADVVGATYGGGTPATANEAFWNGDIPWIQSSNTIEGQLFDVDVRKHISRDGLTHSATQIIPANSVAVVTHVGVGKLVFMPYSYTTSQDFISLSNLKCSPQFLCYALYRKLQEDLHIVQGSAIKGITKEDLIIKQLAMPEIEEQEQIANTLETLDNLITLHQRKLDAVKKFKKSMLQKMFV